MANPASASPTINALPFGSAALQAVRTGLGPFNQAAHAGSSPKLTQRVPLRPAVADRPASDLTNQPQPGQPD